jgi:peptidoglycan/xylan/chitin deacetylase (PgdA/CDA1 family)
MARVSILMYHRVTEPLAEVERDLCISPNAFREQMAFLRERGIRVIGLGELVNAMEQGAPLPENATVITSDDGVSCWYENALPILAEFGYPATCFVVAGAVGRMKEWDRHEGMPARRMLTASECRALAAAGNEMGSHTFSHVKLEDVPPAVAAEEIRASKNHLEDLLGQSVDHFAYPFGSFNRFAWNEVRAAGYRSACSTLPGMNDARTDRYRLQRAYITGQDDLRSFARKLQYGGAPLETFKQAVKSRLEVAGLRASPLTN